MAEKMHTITVEEGSSEEEVEIPERIYRAVQQIVRDEIAAMRESDAEEKKEDDEKEDSFWKF